MKDLGKIVKIDSDRLQELEVKEELFHKICKQHKPLEDLWVKDNKDYLLKKYGTTSVIPDGKELIDWCVKKIKQNMIAKIKIKPLEGYIQPVKANTSDACYDVYASRIEVDQMNGKATIYLGFSTEIPEGWKGVLVPRSSQTKTYWAMLNSPGQIDSGYRGEWMIKLTYVPNLNNVLFPFKVGDRVAQMYFERVNEVELEEVKELGDSERGEGGFGSTGK